MFLPFDSPSTIRPFSFSRFQFKEDREFLAYQVFADFNKTAFESKLPENLKITWSVRLNTTAGRARLSKYLIYHRFHLLLQYFSDRCAVVVWLFVCLLACWFIRCCCHRSIREGAVQRHAEVELSTKVIDCLGEFPLSLPGSPWTPKIDLFPRCSQNGCARPLPTSCVMSQLF